MKVTESDTSGSGHADVSGLAASGATGDGRLPQDDDDNKLFAFFIDLRGRKRYIDVTATAGDGTTGTFMAATYEPCRPKETPVSAADQGLGGRLVG